MKEIAVSIVWTADYLERQTSNKTCK